MGEGPEHNPFAPPAEHADLQVTHFDRGGYHLATYGQRLGGAIIDGLLMIPTMLPALLVIDFARIDSYEENAFGFPNELWTIFIGPLLLGCYQWTMTAKTGQTIAKRWLRTRVILESSGEAPGFVHGVLLRNWLVSAAGMIPGIGSFVGLADALAIFWGNQRQTLHDRVARTIVIRE